MPPIFSIRWEGDGWAVVDPDGFEVDRWPCEIDAQLIADEATDQRGPQEQESDIVHLICCRDSGPALALCGWLTTEHADEDGPECVVCADIADAYPHNVCVRGGRCPQ